MVLLAGELQTRNPPNFAIRSITHLWADIQVVITGCEGINAGTRPIARENDEERKPDLFYRPIPENSVAITLHAGDFAVFMPEELTSAVRNWHGYSIRKAVFKVPRDMLEAQKRREK